MMRAPLHHPFASLMALVLLAALVIAACGGSTEDSAAYRLPPPLTLQEDAGPPANPAPDPEPDPNQEGEPEGPLVDEPKPPEEEIDPIAHLLIPLPDFADRNVLQTLGTAVAERRGLPLMHEVPVFLMRHTDLRDFFFGAYDKDDYALADATESLYHLLGIVDRDTAYLDLLEDFYVGLVLGFYDTDRDQFIVVSDNDHLAARDVGTITHEYVHVLQDQHFAIDAAFDAATTTDATLALRLLTEGDARRTEPQVGNVAAQVAATLEPARDRLPGFSGRMPPALRRLFDAPYNEGVAAVQQIAAAGGTEAINALLREPPPSTEQLLHTDKRTAGEVPLPVPDPDLVAVLGEAWEEIALDTLGEFFLRLTLENRLGAPLAIDAAAGWGGDRLAIYSQAEARLLVWDLQWDTVADAEALFDAWRLWLGPGSGVQTVAAADGARIAWTPSGDQRWWLWQQSGRTWIITSTDASAVERVTTWFSAETGVTAAR